MNLIIPHILSAYVHRSLGRIIEPWNQLYQRGFGGTGTTQDSYCLTRWNVKIHPGQGKLPGILVIFKRNILKVNTSVCYLLQPVFRGSQFHLFVQNFRNTVGAGKGTGKQKEHVGNHHKGIHNLHYIAQKSSQVTYRQIRFQDHISSKPHDQHNSAVHHRLKSRQVQHRIVEGSLAGAGQICVDLREFLFLIFVPDKGFHRTDGSEAFLNHPVQSVHNALKPCVHGCYF